MTTQSTLFESILELLYLDWPFLLVFALTGILLYLALKKHKDLPIIKIIICSILMLYYLCIVFDHIVGIPTIKEFFRVTSFGESLFSPNINLILFANGIGMEFILNIICFIPFGVLCPLISKTYGQIIKMLLLALGLTLLIEMSQLFTLYRATDLNDIITNTLGALIGYLCFKLFSKICLKKSPLKKEISSQKDTTKYIPIIIVIIAFAATFFFG